MLGVALRSKHGATHRRTKTHVYMQPRSLADVTDPGCLTTLSLTNKELEKAQLELLCGQSGWYRGWCSNWTTEHAFVAIGSAFHKQRQSPFRNYRLAAALKYRERKDRHVAELRQRKCRDFGALRREDAHLTSVFKFCVKLLPDSAPQLYVNENTRHKVALFVALPSTCTENSNHGWKCSRPAAHRFVPGVLYFQHVMRFYGTGRGKVVMSTPWRYMGGVDL
jgi:hypothetical protein